MIARQFAPGRVWRRRPVRFGNGNPVIHTLAVMLTISLLPLAILVMAATLCALPLLYRSDARRNVR